MMTHFPLVYRKLLPLGSPPITFETPLSICGRLANTCSKQREEIYKRWQTYSIKLNNFSTDHSTCRTIRTSPNRGVKSCKRHHTHTTHILISNNIFAPCCRHKAASLSSALVRHWDQTARSVLISQVTVQTNLAQRCHSGVQERFVFL